MRSQKLEQGVALIAVLSLLAVLVVLATGTIEITRRHAEVSRRSMETSQALETADSAIRLTLLEMSRQQNGSGNSQSLQPMISVYGTNVTVAVSYEAGRVDLNYADRDMLVAVFASHGMQGQQAETAADSIIDWRDPDDQRQAQGAERHDYKAVGRPGPRNGPFESIEEVRLAMSAEVLDREVTDAFTVYSHAPSVRIADAPPVVRDALRWADARNLGGHRWLDATSAASIRTAAGESIRIAACVDNRLTAICRRAIVRFTGALHRPWQVLSWQSMYAGN